MCQVFELHQKGCVKTWDLLCVQHRMAMNGNERAIPFDFAFHVHLRWCEALFRTMEKSRTIYTFFRFQNSDAVFPFSMLAVNCFHMLLMEWNFATNYVTTFITIDLFNSFFFSQYKLVELNIRYFFAKAQLIRIQTIYCWQREFPLHILQRLSFLIIYASKTNDSVFQKCMNRFALLPFLFILHSIFIFLFSLFNSLILLI